MFSIEKKVESWKQAGIITVEQGSSIVAFEDEVQSKRNWAANGIAGIGIMVLLTGFISMIAANWYEISNFTKLFIYFAAQALLGIFVIKQNHKPGLLREVLITIFAGFFLCGVALISQLYNLTGESWQALGFWLILALPVILIAESKLAPHLWVLGLALTVTLWLVQAEEYDFVDRGLTTVSVAFVLAGIGLYRRPLFSEYFRQAARFWSFIFLAGVVTIAANALWIQSIDRFIELPSSDTALLLILLSALFACALVERSSANYKRSLANALHLMLLSIAIYICLPFINVIPVSSFLAFLCFEFVWATAAVVAAIARRKRIFDLVTIVITVRFIVVYFEIFGSLAATGIGMIISGSMIIAIALGWSKYRRKVSHFLETQL